MCLASTCQEGAIPCGLWAVAFVWVANRARRPFNVPNAIACTAVAIATNALGNRIAKVVFKVKCAMSSEGLHWAKLCEELASRIAVLEQERNEAHQMRLLAEERLATMKERAERKEEDNVGLFKSKEALRQGLKRMREAADVMYKANAEETTRMFLDRNLMNKESRNDIIQRQLEGLEAYRMLVVHSLDHLL